MKHIYHYILFILTFSIIPAIVLSRTHREKYSDVLQHYSLNESDSLKYRAAFFLIDNMDGHFSPEGKQIERFKILIANTNTRDGIRELNEAWNLARKDGGTTMIPDSAVVTSRLLISNIDAAFESWESSSWKEKIDFSTFCKYILPYRCSKEHIGGNWRKALKEEYAHVVSEETDMLKAFAKVRKAVYGDVAPSNSYCPYELDVITTHRIGRAECGQRAILLVDVLRTLGIPAAIDFTPVWADYSDKSHGWVSVIGENGTTYTVFEDDSIAKSFNPIDASVFTQRYKIKEEDNCPYTIKRTKTAAKVYREEFVLTDSSSSTKIGFLVNGFLRDVSDKYGLTSKVIIDAPTDKKVYICTYVSGRDWMPVASTNPINGKAIFENVGKNSVCTACIEEEGSLKFISCPFLVGDDGISKYYPVDMNTKKDISINRKYPLCQYIVEVWGYMRGGVFLGSNDSCFADRDTLAVIQSMPYGLTTVKSLSNREYRFLRYQAPHNNRSSLSELQFCVKTPNGTEKIIGNYTGDGVDPSQLEFLYDDNTATYCRGQLTEYTITLDIGKGKSSKVDNIKYAPSSDLNFVEKGHFYELYYFDTSWHLIDRQTAKYEKLIFRNVPAEAILLLKDKTSGHEERIFEYINGVQLWH